MALGFWRAVLITVSWFSPVSKLRSILCVLEMNVQSYFNDLSCVYIIQKNQTPLHKHWLKSKKKNKVLRFSAKIIVNIIVKHQNTDDAFGLFYLLTLFPDLIVYNKNISPK